MALTWFIEIVKLIGILIPLAIVFLRMNRNNKRLAESFDDLKNIVLESDEERIFDKSLLKVVQKESTEFIDNNDLESPGIISLLIQWKNKFHKLALDSYRSGYRGDRRKTEIYLTNEIDVILGNIELYSLNFFPGQKVFQKENYSFFDYIIEDTELKTIVRALKKDLVNNGLDDSKYIKLFGVFITETFKEMHKGQRRWRRLKTFKNLETV